MCVHVERAPVYPRVPVVRVAHILRLAFYHFRKFRWINRSFTGDNNNIKRKSSCTYACSCTYAILPIQAIPAFRLVNSMAKHQEAKVPQ